MATAQEVYSETVRGLSRAERLRLAALILGDLAQEPDIEMWSDSWTDEDQRDLAAHSLRYAESLYPEDEDLV